MTSRRGQQCPKHVTFVSHEQALAHLGRRVLCGRLGKCRMRSWDGQVSWPLMGCATKRRNIVSFFSMAS